MWDRIKQMVGTGAGEEAHNGAAAPSGGSASPQLDFAGVFRDAARVRDQDDWPAPLLAAVTQRAQERLASGRPTASVVDISDLAGTPGDSQPRCLIEVFGPDKKFLVDTLAGELTRQSITIERLLHPIFFTDRAPDSGALETVRSATRTDAAAQRESLVQIVVPLLDDDQKSAVAAAFTEVLDNLGTVNNDWAAMRDAVQDAARRLRAVDARLGAQEPDHDPTLDPSEAAEWLDWLVDDHFVFLGTRQFVLADGSASAEGQEMPHVEVGEGLGILRDADVKVLRRGTEFIDITPEVAQFYRSPQQVIITKANVVSRLHRRAHMDYIGVKRFDDSGQLTGELRIVGLFTSSAYNRSIETIPILRRRYQALVHRLNFTEDGYNAKALHNVLETHPRDELLQISVAELETQVPRILDLAIRPRTTALARYDEFDRFVSVLAYVPRDQYSTETRARLGDHLARVFQGRISAFTPSFGTEGLVRVHFIVGRDEGTTPRIDDGELTRQIEDLMRGWQDRLATAFAGAATTPGTVARFRDAFSAGYRADHTPERALGDTGVIASLGVDTPVDIRFIGMETPAHAMTDASANGAVPEKHLRVALYRWGQSIPLSRRVPFFENLGFSVIDERSYTVMPGGPKEGDVVRLHDMRLDVGDAGERIMERGDALRACFHAVWAGAIDDDPFNRLVISARLSWQEAQVIRAYAQYLRQIGISFGPRYIAATLNSHGAIARMLVDLFLHRLAPDAAGLHREGEADGEELEAGIETALQEVASLDEDRIIRLFRTVILATVRTNFFSIYAIGSGDQVLPDDTKALAFKFDTKKIEAAPEPKPFREIFVYAPRVEGIHLRGGPVARGGLRWSDRAQDYRTEVLGLAKAQQVKNTVIVPSGAKGGFLPKKLPTGGDRQAVFEEGREAYKVFVSTLISITDNLEGADVVPPAHVQRLDGDDPYLVVAADKGTATFSDTANAISQAHGFWMDDAFASGGSAGYDHKVMGITARGAWEAVKRHFREMDRDIQSEPFTAIGVGDMSGDVFGNGMLLSREIRLLAAFDHRDIFIDPNPQDIAANFAERQRLFDLGRSTWRDYNSELISPGGGVFSRAQKSISLSPEIQQLIGTTASVLTPNQLMQALLKTPVDLLWMGGIGTYVRAMEETDEMVGDHANDAIRVTAQEVGARVIGEGANLGVSQRGRIAFAARGGRMNTDAIDNSAGVNSSDIEVNIKIALRPAVQDGRLPIDARNTLLSEMTEAVADKCLENNYLQTLALSLGQRQGLADLGFQERLMRQLEARGLLDRDVELLPSSVAMEERRIAGQPLTRPELAVLLAYAKIALFEELVESNLPDEPFFEAMLLNYFPDAMRERFADDIRGHRLRREIIATRLSNDIVNRGGSTIVSRLMDETDATAPEIVRAFILSREVLDLPGVWDQIDALDNQIAGDDQLALYQRLQNQVRVQTAWFLRAPTQGQPLAETIMAYRDGVHGYFEELRTAGGVDGHLDPAQLADLPAGLSSEMASRLAVLSHAVKALDLTRTGFTLGVPAASLAGVFEAVDTAIGISRIRTAAQTIATQDTFERLASNSALAELSSAHQSITASIVRGHGAGADAFEAWRAAEVGLNAGPSLTAQRTARLQARVDELLDGGELSVAKLTVIAAQVSDLARFAGERAGTMAGESGRPVTSGGAQGGASGALPTSI